MQKKQVVGNSYLLQCFRYISFLKNKNRQLAIEALLRTHTRCDALQRATRENRNLVKTDELETLLDHRDDKIASNAVRIIQSLKIPNAN